MDWDLYKDGGQLDQFYAEMPKLDYRQDQILIAYYDLRREVESGNRIPSRDIEEVLSGLPYERDCAKLIIQQVDDHYIELYINDKIEKSKSKQTDIQIG